MSTQPQPINRPIPGVMFGLTHELTGELIIREPRILKVGIGLPKGPAIDVWIAPDKRWKVRLGVGPDAKTATFAQRADAEAKFFEALPKATVLNYPRKIAYFTFTKPSIVDGGREQFIPDFDAIEAHGPTPTEIDIVLLDDNPFSGAFQMWSSSELLCKGDGVNAMRLIKLATPEQMPFAQECAAAGEKTFPIDNCWTGTCPYSKETVKNGKPQPSACKPGADLKFQLASNIRVGGTAYFHTTGFRSISSIFSSLHRISTLTGGRLSGIPLKMVLRPFRTNHNGQAATQYAVALEFRAPDVETLRAKLLEDLFRFRQVANGDTPAIAAPHVRLIEAPAETVDEADDDESPIGAAAMAAEFYPDADVEEEPEDATPVTPAATATAEKTAVLAEKLKASAGRTRGNGAETLAPEQIAPAPTNTSEDVF